MSGQCVVGVQRLNFVGDDFHLFLSGLIRSHVFVILLSLSSPFVPSRLREWFERDLVGNHF